MDTIHSCFFPLRPACVMLGLDEPELSSFTYAYLHPAGIDNPAFDALLTEVKHKGVAAVRTQSRAFTSHQAVQVLQSIEHDFEKIETAAVIYDKLINKNSFQLVLNEFSNKADRENLCVRLHINFQENGITADCPDGLNRTETTTASPAVDRCQKGASISKENSPSQTVAVSSLDS